MEKIQLMVLSLAIIPSFLSCSMLENKFPSGGVAGKIFYAQLPSSGTSEKTFIDGDLNLYWFSNDSLSVFQSSTNEKYEFAGTTGQIVNEFHKADASIVGSAYFANYAVYPYSKATTCLEDGTISLILPEIQHYSPDTFGQDANTMVAVTKDSQDDVFYFKNVCGYLRLKIYGGDVIRKISFRGNNGEKIAGAATIRTSYDMPPTIVMSETAKTEITLDCGEEGAATGDTPDRYTSFWIVLPPTVFSKGFTVEITPEYGQIRSQTTTKKIQIRQNEVKQMSAIESGSVTHPRLLSYSLSDGANEYKAFDISEGYVNIMVPNKTNLSDMIPFFTYQGVSVKVDDVEQHSGENVHNFNDFAVPIEYTVTAFNGNAQTYIIRIFDLPVLLIDTPNSQDIRSKTVWVEGATAKLRNTDGSENDLGLTSIKIRGNTTADGAKKPYNIKFATKQPILGMPEHKKWCLMANYYDRTLMRNAICQEIAGLAEGLDWRVKGEFVELILNGELKGNYWLCEKIEVGENRINIDKNDGFLFEYDHWPDDYRFTPKLAKNVFVKLRAPVDCPEDDPDSTKIKQAISYVNDLESAMMTGNEGEYIKRLDVDSFVDVLLIQEFCVNHDAVANNGYMYHDVDGILHAGPVWDFDLDPFANKGHSIIGGMYYPTLLTGKYFIMEVKQRWNIFKEKLKSSTIPDYINTLYESNKRSALRDEVIWPPAEKPGLANRNGDNQLSIEKAKNRILQNYQYQLIWLNDWVTSLTVNYEVLPGTNEDVNSQQDETGNFNFGF